MGTEFYNEETGVFTPITKENYRKAKGDRMETPVIKVIKLDKLVDFADHPFQTYEGERLEKLAESIRDTGLHEPIVVRPIGNGKYEILAGHNRKKAIELLGKDEISAIVKSNLTDEMAERIVVESNLNQQSFADWKYSQQIKVIRIYMKHLAENSRQGERSDKADDQPGAETCDQSEHKSEKTDKKSGKKLVREKSRDKVAKQLGISSSVFERYRSIAKLDEDSLEVLCTALDDKRLGFMSAHRISQLKPGEVQSVVDFLESDPDVKLKGPNVKALQDESKKDKDIELTADRIRYVLSSDKEASQQI